MGKLTFLVILYTLFLSLNGLSQEERFYKGVDFRILDSENETIKNVHLFVDGVPIPYDSTRQSYFLVDTFRMFFDLTAYCDGYDMLNCSRNNLGGYNTDFFSGFFYLKRPSEKFFYASDYWFKVPYTPHPDKLLVILDSRKSAGDDSLLIRFENELKQHGLKINRSFIEAPATPSEQWKYNSYVGLQDRLIIQKEDESDFDTDDCRELGYLRSLEMVYNAGPLIRKGKYSLMTYDNTIRLYNPLRYHKNEEIHQLVKQLDERYYYDEKNHTIILPPETNELVPRIMEQLKEVGFKGQMNLVLHGMKQRAS